MDTDKHRNVILNEVKNLTRSVTLNEVKGLISSFATLRTSFGLRPQNDSKAVICENLCESVV